MFLSQYNIFVSSTRRIFISSPVGSVISPVGFLISPVKILLLGFTPKNVSKFDIFPSELSSPHRGTETGCFFKTNFCRLGPNVLSYRNYKKFNESHFLNDLNKTIITFDNENPNQNYNVLSDRFLEVVTVHTPLKNQIVRGNNVSFVHKQLRKLFILEPS